MSTVVEELARNMPRTTREGIQCPAEALFEVYRSSFEAGGLLKVIETVKNGEAHNEGMVAGLDVASRLRYRNLVALL